MNSSFTEEVTEARVCLSPEFFTLHKCMNANIMLSSLDY